MFLQELREYQLYAKFSKCDFFKDKIQYLGHVVTKEGISVDLEKIKAIEEWSVPKYVIDVQLLMGIQDTIEDLLRGSQESQIP